MLPDRNVPAQASLPLRAWTPAEPCRQAAQALWPGALWVQDCLSASQGPRTLQTLAKEQGGFFLLTLEKATLEKRQSKEM